MKRSSFLFPLAVLLIALLIVYFDVGDSPSYSSGAGEIWWTDAPQVEEAYQKYK